MPHAPAPAAWPGRGAGGIWLAAAAAATAALAIDNERRGRRAEAENPPLGSFMGIDGAVVHYVAAGAGPPVVMLHGACSMVQDFVMSILPRAARKARAYAFDRPGMGYSTRPGDRVWTPQEQARLLGKTMRALGIRTPVVVGHSWGCLVATALAIEEPEMVGGLVLLGGYYYAHPARHRGLSHLLGLPLLAPLASRTLAPPTVRALAERIVARTFAPDPIPPAFTAGFPVEAGL